MRFSTGLLDWLFGKKITIELPNGQKRVVTKRWWAEMERREKVTPVAPDSNTSSDGSLADFTPASMFKHADFIATTALSTLEERLPAFKRLIARDGLDNWSYCFSIAFAYTVFREQPDTLSDEAFDDFRECVQQFLPQLQPDGVDGFNNLHGFMEMGDDIPYQHSLGMWVLWNLADNRPSQNDEIQSAVVLGDLIVAFVGDWWSLIGGSAVMTTNTPSEDDCVAARALLDKAHFEYSGKAWLGFLDEFPKEFAGIHGKEWQSLFGAAVVSTVLFLLSGELAEQAWNRLSEAIRRTYRVHPFDNLVNEFSLTISKHPVSRTEYALGMRVLELLDLCEKTKASKMSLPTNELLCERVGEEAFAKSREFLQNCEF